MTASRRWQICGAVLVAVIAAAVIGLTLQHQHAGQTAGDTNNPTPNVPLVTAQAGVFVERVGVQGRVGPPAGSSAKLAFAQAGIIQAVDVSVGEPVRAGQPLAELDRAALGATVRGAQADVQAAGATGGSAAAARLAVATDKLATLETGGPAALNSRIAAQSAARQAELKVDADRAAVAREDQLFAAGVIAGKDADAARSQLASDEADERAAEAKVAAAGTDFQTTLKQAQADVAGARNDVQTAHGQAASAQARLQSAQIAYANGVLTAPAAGIVLAILKHPGEAVDSTVAALEIGPAIGNNVTLSVPAATAQRIITGDPATLQVTSTGARATQGTVTAVVPAVDPATQSATVVVSGAPAGAVSGDAVSATIVVGHVRGVIVPTTAIVQDPQTGKTVVFVQDPHPQAGDSGFRLRPVVVRAGDATTSVLAAGLRPGERIAAQGGYMLLAPAGG
jgi:multidrug efflux pump subunit AcrA (membrane-fusion protein)